MSTSSVPEQGDSAGHRNSPSAGKSSEDAFPPITKRATTYIPKPDGSSIVPGEEFSVEDPRKYIRDEPEEHRMQRNGARDLTFAGWLLGRGEKRAYSGSREKGIVVDIYLTTRASYFAGVGRWDDDPENLINDEWSIAQTPMELLSFLENSGGERLGPASRNAWNEACKRYPPLRVLETERLD